LSRAASASAAARPTTFRFAPIASRTSELRPISSVSDFSSSAGFFCSSVRGHRGDPRVELVELGGDHRLVAQHRLPVGLERRDVGLDRRLVHRVGFDRVEQRLGLRDRTTTACSRCSTAS
jgi:hypothetical protein